MREPMPVPLLVRQLATAVAARIRATAPPATGPRRLGALVRALGTRARVEDRYLS
jgi:hypothetical protein